LVIRITKDNDTMLIPRATRRLLKKERRRRMEKLTKEKPPARYLAFLL
jgi:hypothetical protein